MSLVGNFFYSFAGGAEVDPRLADLSSVESSVVFDVDATLEDSYDGSSQTWHNLVPSPADGEDQTDYDFWIGIDGTADAFEHTFNGTAGDADAYWTQGGGDFAKLKSGTNTSFLDSLHQTANTTDWWFCFAYKSSANALPINLNMAKSRTSADGIQFNNAGSSSAEYRLIQRNSGGQTISDSNPNYQPGDTWTVVIFSRDTSAGTTKFWINSATETVSDTVAYSSGTDPAGIALRLFSAGDTDVRYVHASAGNTLMTDAKAAAIIAQLEIRHDRTYI